MHANADLANTGNALENIVWNGAALFFIFSDTL